MPGAFRDDRGRADKVAHCNAVRCLARHPVAQDRIIIVHELGGRARGPVRQAPNHA